MLYLYDPINNIKTPTTYGELRGLTGRSKGTLEEYKNTMGILPRINCFIVGDDLPRNKLRYLMTKVVFKDEIWKKITSVKNLKHDYYVSHYGRFKKVDVDGKELLLMPFWINNVASGAKGIFVKLRLDDGRLLKFRTSRLVAHEFLTNDAGENAYVVHKDGVLTNGHASNLKWVTGKEIGIIANSARTRRMVAKLDPDTGRMLKVYRTVISAAQDNGVSNTAIRTAIKKNRKSAGFKWKDYNEDDYLDNEEDELYEE